MGALLGLSKPLAALRGADPLRVRFLALLTAGHMVNHWHQGIYPVVVPTIKAALGLTDVEVGTLSAARQLVNMVLNVPVGMASDALGRHRHLLLGSAIAIGGAAYGLLGQAPSYLWALVGSMLIGLSISVWHPVAMSSIALKFTERRGAALAVHGTGATILDSVTPLVVGALLSVVAWQGLLTFQVVPAAILAFVLWRALASSFAEEPVSAVRSAGTGARLRELGALVKNRVWVGLTAAMSFWSTGRLIVTTFLPIYLAQDLGYSTVVLGLYLALLNVLGIVSQGILGFLSDRFGRKIVLVPSFTILGLLYVALAYAPPGLVLSAVIAAIGIFFYTLANVMTAAMYDVVDPGIAATAQSVSSVITSVASLPAPVIAGLMIGVFGIGSTFVLSGVLLLVGAATMLPLRMYGGRRAA